jgi:hypothetical protein
MKFFIEIEKAVLKIHMKLQRNPNSQNNPLQKEQSWSHHKYVTSNYITKLYQPKHHSTGIKPNVEERPFLPEGKIAGTGVPTQAKMTK